MEPSRTVRSLVTAPRVRLGALAFAVAGVLFVLYPAVRPWADESTAEGATAALGSTAWVYSHLFAMVGFVLVPIGLLALYGVVARTRAEPVALAAVVAGWLGAGLTLPYYGAEDFGLHAVGRAAADGGAVDVLDLAEAVRFGPVAVTTFGIGLIALGVAAVLAAVAIWRSGVLPRAGGLLFAAGFVLFLPQFYTPPAARIGHGVLLGAGCLWVAWLLWRSARR
ncbi:hypothetical protein GCM10009779_36180 [Polymorphospora rubra]|uniref:DUF4386 family protein n=1 Tax=Polymorphospora rubra TaxID=338584 RepID=A0A810NAI0_9ACTN|nr:hypothetical protein Prubr_72480 [Polymorphospora rubra]